MKPYRIFTALRAMVLLTMTLVFAATLSAAQTTDDTHTATGGGQTLEDIMARQAGEAVDDTFRRVQTGTVAGAASGQLGTLGGASDADVYRTFRFGDADITVSSRTEAADVVMQSSGMKWLEFRNGPLRTYGLYLLGGMLALILLFYVIRGKIRIEGELTGILVKRFKPLERLGHWLMASSFIVLALTGLASLFGRIWLVPLIGKEAFSSYAVIGKMLHDSVGWAFIVSLIWIFVFWAAQNLPNKHDINWLLKAGGLFKKGVHPPAKKFNAGEKVIFWSVILLGGSIAVTGLSQLFPFQIPAFAWTFDIMNAVGFDMPTLLAHEEMQLEHIWHVSVSFILIAIVIAHIYLGSVGMEGAGDAMVKGEVDRQWAKEHHDLWLEELDAKAAEES